MVYWDMNNIPESKDFFLSLLRNVPYGVVAITYNGTIRMMNEVARKSFSIKGRGVDLVGAPFIPQIKDIKRLKNKIINFIERGEKDFHLKGIFFKDKYLNIFGTAIPDGILISVNNVTKTKIAEKKAGLALLRGQELERRRLAEEIHDGVGPTLSTLRLHLDNLKKDCITAFPSRVNKLEEMGEMLQEVSTEIRAISHALMPGALIDFGLVKALENLCIRINKGEGATVDFFHNEITKRASRRLEFNLYRIAQELLNNAIKYSDAKHIDVQLLYRINDVVLMVEDDGKGFERQLIEEKLDNGYGLKNIKTRVRLLGGVFTLETEVNHGVQAIIEVPLTYD